MFGRTWAGILLSVSSVALLNASRPLNPTVKLLAQPATASLSECEEGLAPQQMARLELPEPMQAAAPAPRTTGGDLRSLLTATQAAASRGDRDGFRDALARLKSGPTDSVSDIVRVYDDLDRVWTFEFETPTGAFFNASSGLVKLMSGYPGWENAVANQTLVVSGTKFYPTRETRDFLVREAAVRLSRMGLGRATEVETTTSRPSTTTPATTSRPATRKREEVIEDTTKALPPVKVKSHAKRKKADNTIAPAKPASAIAAVVPKSVPKPTPSSSPPMTSSTTPITAPLTSPPPATASAASASPSSAPVTHTVATTSAAAPATETATPLTTSSSSPAPASTSSAVPSTTSATTPTSSAASTETTATTAPIETSAPDPQPAKVTTGRNIILPIVLIVAGIGVLIVLFRTSS